MNRSKRIIFLTAIVAGIIVFWLMPGINKADDTRYVRYYEDTYAVTSAERLSLLNNDSDTTSRKRKKVYRKETIEPRKRKVNSKMFSRAIHFEPVLEDSIKNVEAKAETEKIAQ